MILFGANIDSAEQTVRLIDDLQRNNAQGSPQAIPYLISADQECGSVARLSMGTRGTGSMAIGATGEAAEENAKAIGQVFGEELEALGINVNLGPCIDVIADLADPGMSTRVFSDDPQTVSRLGLAFAGGVGQSNVVTCYKHFPGAGDGSDYPTSIWLLPDLLRENGLSTYRAAIEGGTEMVMISAMTFPLIDDEMLMADGVTKGFWPATLSPKIVTGMLREALGFDGVVMTDALEMQQFVTEPDTGAQLFTGEYATVEHDIQVIAVPLLPNSSRATAQRASATSPRSDPKDRRGAAGASAYAEQRRCVDGKGHQRGLRHPAAAHGSEWGRRRVLLRRIHRRHR